MSCNMIRAVYGHVLDSNPMATSRYPPELRDELARMAWSRADLVGHDDRDGEGETFWAAVPLGKEMAEWEGPRSLSGLARLPTDADRAQLAALLAELPDHLRAAFLAHPSDVWIVNARS